MSEVKHDGPATMKPVNKDAEREALLKEVETLESRFADNPNDELVRLSLHVARVRAGWVQFQIDTVSGAEPRLTIPWVAILPVRYSEEWPEETYKSKTPLDWWLRPSAEILSGGRTKKVANPKLCTDGKWRRDVSVEVNVVAVEDLAHLCSIVKRMEDMILYKPDVTGLMKLTIFDQAQH